MYLFIYLSHPNVYALRFYLPLARVAWEPQALPVNQEFKDQRYLNASYLTPFVSVLYRIYVEILLSIDQMILKKFTG